MMAHSPYRTNRRARVHRTVIVERVVQRVVGAFMSRNVIDIAIEPEVE